MRAIHEVRMDQARPAVLLTREDVVPYRTQLTVAPISSTVRGLAVEVPVGPANGLDHASVVSCDNITTVPSASVGRLLGHLLDEQENALADAVVAAFDLDV